MPSLTTKIGGSPSKPGGEDGEALDNSRSREPPELSKLVEESVHQLHEMERRLHSVQSDIANLINLTMASAPATTGPAPFPGAPGPSSPWIQGFPTGAPPNLSLGLENFQRGFNSFGAYSLPARSAPAPFSLGSGLGYGDTRTTKEFANQAPLPRAPELNVVDAGDEYVVQVELPGVRKEDLEITVADRNITVAGVARPNLTEGSVIVGEVVPVQYRRTIPLPSSCNANGSKASLKDGYLTLRVPKKEPTAGPRRLDVAYG